MTKAIRIKTIDGRYYKFPLDDIFSYDFEYSPTILRIDFKDSSFIEFTKNNIIFAGIGLYVNTREGESE